jgi:hypothetical protein
VVIGAPLWALAMSASAGLNLWHQVWATRGSVVTLLMLFAAGGLIAFPIGLFVARFLAAGGSRQQAFAAALVAFTLATLGATAAIYALDYRQYYSEWHDSIFTLRWVFELVFTALAALYQFAVLGVRLYFPLGFLALFAVSLWFARLPH